MSDNQNTTASAVCPACQHGEHQWCGHDPTYDRCDCAGRGHAPSMCVCSHSREAHALGQGYGRCNVTGCRCAELRAPRRVMYTIRDNSGHLVSTGDCLETELQLIRAQTPLLGRGWRIIVWWPPTGPTWRSTGTVEGWMKAQEIRR